MHANAQAERAGVTCEVIAPSVIEHTTDLTFGRFSAADSGTVSIGVDGERTSTGAVTLVASDSEQTAARIDLRGDVSSGASITLPSGTALSLDDGAGHEITVQLFDTRASAVSRSADGDGFTLVGASLTVAADQPPGSYVGRFDVIVEYN